MKNFIFLLIFHRINCELDKEFALENWNEFDIDDKFYSDDVEIFAKSLDLFLENYDDYLEDLSVNT
jgi:hypothetical protein